MSTNNPANSAALLDAMGNQLLPNTRAELVWVKATGSGNDKKAAPFDVPGGEPKDIRLSALLAETVYLGNTQTITGQKTFSLNLQLASGKGVVGAFGTNYRNLVTANGSDAISVGDSEVANTNIVAKTSTTIKYGANTVATFNVNGVNGTNFIHGNGGAYKGITTAGQTIGLIRAADGNVTIGDHQNNGIKGLVSNTEVYNATKSKTTFTATDSIEGKIGSSVVTVTNSKGFYSNGGVAAMGILEAGSGGGSVGKLADCSDVDKIEDGGENYVKRTEVSGTNNWKAQQGDVLYAYGEGVFKAKPLFDNNGKVLVSTLPDSLLGQVLYGGNFNASGVCTLTNSFKAKYGTESLTITTTNASAYEGVFFIASASGTVAGKAVETGDWLISDGSAWQKVDNNDAVTGVKGDSETVYRTGQINITKANIGLGNVENTALSSWAGSGNITTLGTITSGIWHGSKIAKDYLADGVQTSLGKADSAVQDANYKHITVTSTSVSDGTNTFNKYVLTNTDVNALTGLTISTSGNAATATTATNLASAPSLSFTSATSSSAGSTLTVSAGGKTSTAITIDKVRSAFAADSATKATQDASGNVITTTYATKTELTNEVNARKARDVNAVKVGRTLKRKYNDDETQVLIPQTSQADNDTALRIEHHDGTHVDIKRGTDVDINAANLIGEAVPQKDQMFGYRTTAGDASIKPTGTAHIDKLCGNSIVWNQRVKDEEPDNAQSITTKNGSLYNVKVAAQSTEHDCGLNFKKGDLPTGHRIIISFNAYCVGTTYTTLKIKPNNIWYGNYDATVTISSVSNRYDVLITPSSLTGRLFIGRYNNTQAFEFNITRPNLIDLTQMFGSDANICKALGVANLDTTDNRNKAIANFKSMFPNSYYPYNVGELVSFGGEGVELETVGRNLWDEDWELGVYSNGGTKIDFANSIRGKNFISILNPKIYVASPKPIKICCYDANKSFVSVVIIANASRVLDSNIAYITISCENYGTTYNHDICISLLWSGSRTGYEPYERHTLPVTPYVPEEFNKSHTYELGNLVLHDGAMYKRKANGGVKKDWVEGDWDMVRCAGGGIGQALSAGEVHDEYYEDHCVIKVGSIDLGTPNWSNITTVRMLAPLPTYVKTPISNQVVNIVCATYKSVNYESLSKSDEDMVVSTAQNGHIGIRNKKYNDTSDLNGFVASLQGVILYYELAEPITIWYNTKQNFDYFADDYGTEGWIPQTGSTPRFVPPFLDLTYGINVVDEVRSLPNYLKKEDYIKFDHINTDTDDDHREAALVTDTGGNGYVISQLGYKVGSDVYDEVPV